MSEKTQALPVVFPILLLSSLVISFRNLIRVMSSIYAMLNIFFTGFADILLVTQTHWLVWQFDMNLTNKRNQSTWHSSTQRRGLRGCLKQIPKTSQWHLHCSKKKHISYPLQENSLKDTSETFNQWHSTAVTFHMHT